ncbi:MAG: hypothetical protein IT428_28180 [Planctomycetaceae bacterium]|nr:hypothetical protein [Planctomycetaceae bacterium]
MEDASDDHPAPNPLHRLFGLSLTDFFQGTDVTVELEVDLSHRQQFLDVVLIRRGTTPLPRRLPDGFEELAPHNLVSFKSHRESLDGWALCELIGHYVNYRKQAGASMQDLLPESDFRMYAVCVRYPQNLANSGVLTAVSEGVWDAILPGVATIRIIVVHRLPQEEHNAILHLFSAQAEPLRYARDHYRPHSKETSTLLYQLYRIYQEDPAMATQLEEFARKTIEELLKELPPEKRLEGLTPEDRLEGLSPEDRLEGLSPEERLQGMSPEEQRKAFEVLKRQLGSNGSTPPSN